MGGAVGVAFVIGPDQQAVGHIANKLTADIPPGTDTDTLMFNLEIGLIIDITEAQCPGIQRVLSAVAVLPITAPSSWVPCTVLPLVLLSGGNDLYLRVLVLLFL